MRRRKYDDPDGMKICRRCLVIKPHTKEHYHQCTSIPSGLTSVCKDCSNYLRRYRWKHKLSHNIKSRCVLCDSFFWAARSQINKGFHKYCSNKCRHKARKTSLSWNGRRRGMGNPNHRLVDQDIIEIKQMLALNTDYNVIANKFNISYSYVSNIKNGRLWSHIQI